MSLLDRFRRPPEFGDLADEGSTFDHGDDYLDAPFLGDERAMIASVPHGFGLVASTSRGGRVDLASILQHAAQDGMKVTYEEGWRTRGAPVMNPTGVLLHWTAAKPTAKNPAPSRTICRDGRPAYPKWGMKAVPGPLVHFLIGLDGMIYAIASGRANHAGAGDVRLLTMLGRALPSPRINPGRDNGGSGGALYGIEVENPGGGVPFAPAQIVALRWLVQSICAYEGWDPLERVVCHDEWTTRKVDITKPGNPWKQPADFRNDFARRVYLLADGRIVKPTSAKTATHIDGPTVMALFRDGWTQLRYHRTDLKVTS